jgi:hypothetical protein
MFEVIILLRLEYAARTADEAAAAATTRFVPICPGMTFKQSRPRR